MLDISGVFKIFAERISGKGDSPELPLDGTLQKDVCSMVVSG